MFLRLPAQVTDAYSPKHGFHPTSSPFHPETPSEPLRKLLRNPFEARPRISSAETVVLRKTC